MKSPRPSLGPCVPASVRLVVRPGFRVEFEPLVVASSRKARCPRKEPTIKQDALTRRIEAVLKELDVDLAIHSSLVRDLRRAVRGSSPSKGFRKEIVEARARRDRLAPLEREILRLLRAALPPLGGTSPHEILHDIRNVLNEVGLLKVITDGSH